MKILTGVILGILLFNFAVDLISLLVLSLNIHDIQINDTKSLFLETKVFFELSFIGIISAILIGKNIKNENEEGGKNSHE